MENKLYSYDASKSYKENLSYFKFLKESWHLDTKASMPSALLLCKDNNYVGLIASPSYGFESLYFALECCKKMFTADEYIILFDSTVREIQQKELLPIENKFLKFYKNLFSNKVENKFLFAYRLKNEVDLDLSVIDYEMEDNQVIWKKVKYSIQPQSGDVEKNIQDIFNLNIDENVIFSNTIKILESTKADINKITSELPKEIIMANFLFSYLANCSYVTLLNPKYYSNIIKKEPDTFE